MIEIESFNQQEDSVDTRDIPLPSGSEEVGFEGGGVSNDGTSGSREAIYTAEDILNFAPNVDPKICELFLMSPLPSSWIVFREAS
jgi:hypothetical protein